MLLAGCEATIEKGTLDAPAVTDTSVDTPMEKQCPTSSTLSICLSFDAAQLGGQLANEGTLAITASAVDVTRTAAPLTGGGAAQFSPTSTLSFAANTGITGIVAIDTLVRIDQPITAGARMGLVDSDNGMPGMSLFLYPGTVTPQQIRCNIGGSDVFSDTTITLGTWTELACTCEAGNVAIKQNGVKIAEVAGCTPAAAAIGLQIGQNSRADDMLPPNDPFIGAIDRVRLWTAVP